MRPPPPAPPGPFGPLYDPDVNGGGVPKRFSVVSSSDPEEGEEAGRLIDVYHGRRLTMDDWMDVMDAVPHSMAARFIGDE